MSQRRRSPLPENEGSRYSLLAELGRGGLGRVWAATDDLVGREVAVKQVLEPSPESIARFEREARLTARLQHAGIVPVYDVGWSDAGEPFFVMRKVEGRSLAELIARAASTGARMALLPRVLAVAETVAYAHGQGVIHRDLKPSNVVVSDHGETLVIDWGLAKSVAEPDATDLVVAARGEEPGLTQQGAVIGTPQFMAPEQARGQAVDARADVYALGAIIYNVLAGREPGGDPGRLKSLSRKHFAAPPPLRQLVPDVPSDLLAIVDKAMAPDASSRYADAAKLGEDLRRFLDGRLVTAHRYSAGALIARWIRRHRAATVAVAISISVLVVAGILGVRRIVLERNNAVAARKAALARENALVLLQAELNLTREPTAALAWIKRFQTGTGQDWLARAVAEEAVARGVARHVFRSAIPSSAMATAARAPIAVLGGQDGGVEVVHLTAGRRRRLAADPTSVRALAVTADGRRILALHGSGRLELWSSEERLLAVTELGPSPGGLLTLSPDESRVAVGTGGESLRFLATADLAPISELRLASRVSAAEFCGDEAVLVLGKDGLAGLAGTQDGVMRVLPGRHADARAITLSDGQHFVTGAVDGEVRLWSCQRGLMRPLIRHVDWVSALAQSLDGRWVASGAGDDVIHLTSLAGGAPRRLLGHGDTIRGLMFTPNGTLVSASFESLRFWDPETGTLLRSFPIADGRPTRWALADGGRRIVATAPHETRVWSTEVPDSRLLVPHAANILLLAWSPDGAGLASSSRDHRVHVHDFKFDKGWSSPPLDSWPVFLSFLDPRNLVVTTRLLTTSLVQPGPGRIRRLLGTKAAASGSAHLARLDPTGQHLVYVDQDAVTFESLTTGVRRRLAPTLPSVTALDFSEAAGLVAACSRMGVAMIWDVASGKVLHVHRGQQGCDAALLSPDGRTAALVTRNQNLRFWRLQDGALISVPGSFAADVRVQFVGNDRVAYIDQARSVGMVDVPSRSTQLTRGHRASITDLVVSPTRALVATGDANGFVRLWDFERRRAGIVHGHRGAVEDLAFSPDGRRLASGGPDGEIRVWNAEAIDLVPMDRWNRANVEASSSARVDGHGRLFTSQSTTAGDAVTVGEALDTDL